MLTETEAHGYDHRELAFVYRVGRFGQGAGSFEHAQRGVVEYAMSRALLDTAFDDLALAVDRDTDSHSARHMSSAGIVWVAFVSGEMGRQFIAPALREALLLRVRWYGFRFSNGFTGGGGIYGSLAGIRFGRESIRGLDI